MGNQRLRLSATSDSKREKVLQHSVMGDVTSPEAIGFKTVNLLDFRLDHIDQWSLSYPTPQTPLPLPLKV